MERLDRPRFAVLVVTIWPDADPDLRVRARFVTAAGAEGPTERSAAAGSEGIVRWFRQWIEQYAEALEADH